MKFNKLNKKAELLHETIIFVVLNVTFLTIMIVFIYLQGNSIHLKEEAIAKRVALLIDVARPGTELNLNLEDFSKRLKKEGVLERDSIKIDEERNLIIVRGSKKSFFEYGYFNDGVKIASNFYNGKLNLKVVGK